MIRVMSYELNHNQIECLNDNTLSGWVVIDRGHPIYCKSFKEASQKMDKAIEALTKCTKIVLDFSL